MTVTRRVSPLFSYPLGDGMRTESYLSEDITWSRFNKICSAEMRLREGCIPELAWKFSDGQGSKEWILLRDEDSYKRMMEAGASRIHARAKKESNLKDANLAHGWRIDLKLRNKVQRIEEEEDEEDVAVSVKVKEKMKKKKKGSKEKPTKRKRGGQKKASLPPDCNPATTDIPYIFSPGKRPSLQHWAQGLEHQAHQTQLAATRSLMTTLPTYRLLQRFKNRTAVLGVQHHVWC